MYHVASTEVYTIAGTLLLVVMMLMLYFIGNGYSYCWWYGCNLDNVDATSVYLTPSAITGDSDANIYVVDQGHTTVRIVNATNGYIDTYAGGGSYSVTTEGILATTASFNSLGGVWMDSNHDLYVSDYYYIYKCYTSSDGALYIKLLIGSTSGSSGEYQSPTSAYLYHPYSLWGDSAGNLFFADYNYHRVRVYDVASDMVYTVAGYGGGAGYNGDDMAATSAYLYYPSGTSECL